MPITYRTAGDWGAGKGGNLTPAEVDGNFYDLAQQIAGLELGPTPAEIDTISVVGNQMTITLDDARSFGPYTIPTAAFRWRGAWAAATPYLVNDLVTVAGQGVFLVLVAHTSDSTFDPDYLVGSDIAYQLVLEEVRYAFDYQGDWAASTSYSANDVVSVAGQGIYLVLQDHTSDTTFDPARVISAANVYQLMYSEPRSTVIAVPDNTLTPSTVWAYHRCTSATGCAVTIETNATVPVPVGTEFHFRQCDAGVVSIAGAVGVTLNIPAGANPQTAALGAVMTAKKVDVDEWDVFGLLGEATA